MSSPDEALYVVSSSPHAHSGSSVQRIMLDVIIALLPILLFALFRDPLNTVRLVTVCVGSCMVLEWGCRRLMHRENTVGDYSAALTGLLLAFNLPPEIEAWRAVVGSVFAIVIAKQLFGGLGYNPFNPALVGRVAMLMAFAGPMTQWMAWQIPAPAAGIDAISTATPLMLVNEMKAGAPLPFTLNAATVWDLASGTVNGCLGETSALAILLGGMYMLARRVITWHTPVAYLGTVAVFSTILWAVAPAANFPPHFHLLSGGLMLGAVFMATDMVTSPVTRKGQFIFGVGCGVLTMVIRKWGSMPEGVSVAILLMNAVTPLINRATRPRKFGARRKAKS